MGAYSIEGFGSMPPRRSSFQMFAASLWAMATSHLHKQHRGLQQERKYAPYVPTHAGTDFANSATPRYMRELNETP